MEYTKRSWIAIPGDENIDYEVWTADEQHHICGLERLDEKFISLLLAAPDMYEALKVTLHRTEDMYLIDLIEKALSKAEGRQE